jgi:ketosteroid isomerase-like protein
VSHVTEDFENKQMGVLGACFTGKALYRERLTGFLKKFRQLNYTPEDVIANDNKVAITYRMTSDDEGCAIDIHGVMIITVSGDKVSRRCDYWDGLSYLAQTGISLS